MTIEGVVRCNRGDGPAGFADVDGDVLAVGQGHDDRAASHWLADGGGVGDGATFSRGWISLQGDGRGVDGVGDVGHGRSRIGRQVLEVTASGTFDGGLNGAGILVHVIGWRWDGHGAGGFTGVDGDHRAVAQGDGHRGAGRVGQGCGVGDLTTFSDGVGCGQRQVGGVDGVSNGGRNRGFVGDQVFVVAAAYTSNRVGQWGVTIEGIVRCNSVNGAAGFADVDSDGLAVGQRYGDRRAGHWLANRRGVSDGATFSCGWISLQGDGRGVDGVGDVGHGRSRIGRQVLEVATGCFGDRCLHGAGIFVHVIGWRWDGHGAGGFTGVDGDHRAVAQGDGYRGAGRVGQCRGVNNRTAFSYGISRAQAEGRGVYGISDVIRNRGFVGHQVFVVTAADVADRVSQWRMTVERVVRCNGGDGASGFTDVDGDGLAVGQGYGDWRASHWLADGGGVSDGATFSCGWISLQGDSRGVDGVGDVGHGRSRIGHQVLEVTASGTFDGGLNGAGILVHVIGWRWDGHGAGGFTGVDGDHRAVAQGDGHRGAGRVGQGCGVGDLTTFGHRVGCGQRQVGGVDGVSDVSRNRGFVGHQVFVVAAADVADRVGQWRVTVERVVRCNRGDGPAGFADVDGDVLAVGQGHDDRAASHWLADGGGVGDGATFSRGWISLQSNGRGVDGVSDVGHGRSRIGRQVLEVTASGTFDGGLNGAGILVHVIGRSWDGHGAGGFTGVDGDHRAIAQGDGHGCAGRVGQGGGVGDLATFSDRVCRAKAQRGGINGVSDRSRNRRFVGNQVFVVAAAYTSNRVS